MATIVIKDKNLVPQNIKRGVTILKVTGTLDASGGGSANLQEKTVNSSTVSQNVTPSQGYDGLSKVTVNPYTLDTKTVDASTVSQTVTSDEDGLSSVTVNPYTLDSKTVDPSTSQQTVNSSADGLSSVTVTAVTSSIDQNIAAGNIKKDVTILGVTGTFEGGGSAPVLQDVSVSYSQNGEYTLSASSGYDGLGTVDISVNVPSQGGEPWYIQAKKGQITDVSNCSFGGLENIDYGAVGALAGTAITTAPQMSFTSVAPYAFMETFRDCRSMDNADVSIHVDGSIGERAFERSFAGAEINSITFDASVISGNYCFENAFANTANVGIVNNITFTCTEITGIGAFNYGFYSSHGTGTASFPNLTTVGQAALTNAFCDTQFDTVSIPNLVNVFTDWDYSLYYMLSYSNVRKLICNPIILNNPGYDLNPLTEAYNLQTIEFSANATDNMYFYWQQSLTSEGVYNILSHLDLTVSGKEVVFAEWTIWDEQSEGEVTVNLTVYDYPDGRIQTAYDAATTAGWTITNLTIVPTTSLNYISTGNTDSAMLNVPGVKTDDTMFETKVGYNTSYSSSNYFLVSTDTGGSDVPSGFSAWREDNYGGGPGIAVGPKVGGTWNTVSLERNSGYAVNFPITFGFIKYGDNRRVYVANNNVERTGNRNSTFVPNNADLKLQSCKFYYLKQWEGWDDTSTGGSGKVLVHDYVPVSVDNSGTTQYGLFDQVTGVFYTNTGITGA